jgi:carboxylesterase
MTNHVLPDAEPFSAPGGPDGAIVLHGFTGSPQSMRPLAKKLAGAGFAVELPLLPGHGTSVDDMIPTRWHDWYATVDAAFTDLAARSERMVLVGLSMGATLALQLAIEHRGVAGVVAINAALMDTTEPVRMPIQEFIDAGETTVAGIGSDVADPSQKEQAYEEVPLESMMSMFDGIDGVVARLDQVHCPVLVLHSTQDHVVPPGAPDLLRHGVKDDVEIVTLERSFHVATIDYDHDIVEDRTVEFAKRVTAR